MIRISNKQIKRVQATTGEIDCLEWKGILFRWEHNINNVDEYSSEGYFVGIDPRYVYFKLTIRANFIDNVFHLKTGWGKPVTYVNLIDD